MGPAEGTGSSNPREVALEAVAAAGDIARRGFLTPRRITAKGTNDIVTEIDVAGEEAICAILARRFPDDGILAEERGRVAGTTPYLWIIDPLDGTHNYAAQLPFWCISVARYNTATGEVEVGAIYDPLHEETFVAVRGGGAELNGQPIHVTTGVDLRQSMVACDIGYVQAMSDRLLHTALLMQPQVRRLRILGSAVLALAYVACGRIDTFFHLHLMPWDLAAAWLLIEEAGGRCTTWTGRRSQLEDREIVAAPPDLHAAFLDRLTRLQEDRRL